MRGLLAGPERKNGWILAEFAGQISPDGMQRLVRNATWDAEGTRRYQVRTSTGGYRHITLSMLACAHLAVTAVRQFTSRAGRAGVADDKPRPDAPTAEDAATPSHKCRCSTKRAFSV